MSSPKKAIRKIASSASDMIAKATNINPTEEKGNTVEKKSLLNTTRNDQEDPYQFEWEIEDQIYKQQDQKQIKLSQNWIVALIIIFVLFCGILLSYLFIFDYFSVENDNEANIDNFDRDDERFRLIGIGDVSRHDVIQLKKDIRSLFDEEYGRALLGGAVRLVFNDCSGPKIMNGTVNNQLSICDGCIDDKNPTNADLHHSVIQQLEQVFIDNAYDKIMSRADFWIAAGTIAIQYAAELKFEGEIQILKNFANQIDIEEAANGGKFDASEFDPNGGEHQSADARMLLEQRLKLVDEERDQLPPLKLMFGRMDCISSPFAKILDDTHRKEAPSPNKGWKYNYKWFNKNFGFDINETVAIMGAHTLGSHKGYNGLAMNWVTEPNVFDNEYYSVMMDKTQGWHLWKSDIEDRMQFVNKGSGLSMLHSDMALLYDIDSKDCDMENVGCSFQEDTYPIFVKYASDNQLFYNDFVKAWTKMVSIGYNKRMLTRFEV